LLGQIVTPAAVGAAGIGLTVIVYVEEAPVQPASVGVTVMVDVIGEPVAFVAVKAGVFPFPEAANPIPVLEFVQVKVAPAGVLVYALAGTASPAQ
jgi:hypothetical protein